MSDEQRIVRHLAQVGKRCRCVGPYQVKFGTGARGIRHIDQCFLPPLWRIEKQAYLSLPWFRRLFVKPRIIALPIDEDKRAQLRPILDRWEPMYRRWKDRYYSRQRHLREREQGPGFTQAEFDALCEKWGWRCLRCGRPHSERPLTKDHVAPVARGGAHHISNIQPLCLECNMKKHTATCDFRTGDWLERYPGKFPRARPFVDRGKQDQVQVGGRDGQDANR